MDATTDGSERGTIGGPLLAAQLFALFAATVVFPMLSPAVPYPNGVALQLARWQGETRAREILTRWAEDDAANLYGASDRIERARSNVRFDFLFIIGYAYVFYRGCRWASDVFAVDGFVRLARWGRTLVAPAQVVAGACDAIENAFLLRMLEPGAAVESWSLPATAFASVKLALLLIGAGWIYAALARSLGRLLAPTTGTGSRAIGVLLLAAQLLSLVAATVIFPRLSPAVPYPDIVDLEMARQQGVCGARVIVDRWAEDDAAGLYGATDRIARARWNVRFDYLFIVAYSYAFYRGCRWASDVIAADGFAVPARLGRTVIAPAQIVAGLCDAVENVFLLTMLGPRGAIESTSLLATAFASAKFALLAIGAVWIYVALARSLGRLLSPGPAR